MKNFLFIVPKYVKKAGDYYFFPNGIGYVVSYLKSKGYKVFCINLCHSDAPIEEQIISVIKKNNIDVICTGGMSVHWNIIEDILKIVKKNYHDKPIVVGGAIVSCDPEFAMNQLPIDYGIIGEGEITMGELASELCAGSTVPSKVDGLIYRGVDGTIIKNKPREAICDLDALPFPDYEALEYEKYFELIRWYELPSFRGIYFDIDENQRVGDILTSRSCPYMCTFCYHPLGNKYRQRSLKNVFQEIDYLSGKYNIRILNIVDELFSLKEGRIREFCSQIKRYNLLWNAQWRVDNVSRELLTDLKSSGLISFGLGTESMSDTVLRSMKKYTTSKQVDNAYKIADSVGIRAGGNLIFGDINETRETMDESLDWYFKNPQYDINLGIIKAVPDSEDWQYALKKGLITDKLAFIKAGFPIINFSKLGKEDFIRCQQIIFDSEYNLDFLMPGKTIATKALNDHYKGKLIYEFKIECPICRNESIYKHHCFTSNYYFTVLCKKCLKRLRIRSASVFYKEPRDLKMIIIGRDSILRVFYRRKLKSLWIIRSFANLIKKILRMP